MHGAVTRDFSVKMCDAGWLRRFGDSILCGTGRQSLAGQGQRLPLCCKKLWHCPSRSHEFACFGDRMQPIENFRRWCVER